MVLIFLRDAFALVNDNGGFCCSLSTILVISVLRVEGIIVFVGEIGSIVLSSCDISNRVKLGRGVLMVVVI